MFDCVGGHDDSHGSNKFPLGQASWTLTSTSGLSVANLILINVLEIAQSNKILFTKLPVFLTFVAWYAWWEVWWDVVQEVGWDVGFKHASSMLQASFKFVSRELEFVAASESWQRPCFEIYIVY